MDDTAGAAVLAAAGDAGGGRGDGLEGRGGADECVVWGAYERIADRLRRAAYRVCRNGHDAEDAVHDAILAAHRALPSLRDPARLEPWLFRIARNHAATEARRRRRFRADDRLVDDDPAEGAPGPRVAARFGSSEPPAEAVLAVRCAFDGAPAEWREAFEARFGRGLSFAQIAAQQGVSVACVKTRLSRVRARLREEFPDPA